MTLGSLGVTTDDQSAASPLEAGGGKRVEGGEAPSTPKNVHKLGEMQELGGCSIFILSEAHSTFVKVLAAAELGRQMPSSSEGQKEKGATSSKVSRKLLDCSIAMPTSKQSRSVDDPFI